MKDKNKMIVVVCDLVIKNMISMFYGEEYRFIFIVLIMDFFVELMGYISCMVGFFFYVFNIIIKEYRYICFYEL